jgi:myosin heavy subunit
MTKKKSIIIFGSIGVVVVVLVVALLVTMKKVSDKNSEMTGMVQQMDYEKNQLQQEYADFAKSTDGLQFKTNNDSLSHQIITEKQRIQSLMQELKIVKSTDTQRINELKKELATVRGVLMHYVAMVDSLNRVNEALTSENKEVKQKYVQASQNVAQLSKEKSSLAEKVTLAARLDAKSLSVETLTDRNRKTDKVGKTTMIKINFTIAKNVTASPGNKYIYARIMTPDNEVLSKSAGDLFPFENRQIQFSCKKMEEYQGEDLPDVLYWKVGELLFPGTYRVDLFADGNLIGQTSFRLSK